MVIFTTKLGDGSGDSWASAIRQYVDVVNDRDVFGSDWACQQQARLFAVDNKCRQWATSSALLTASASTTWPGGDDPIPPITHLKQGILASREARHKALSRSLSSRKWRAVRYLGADDNGYLHRHTAVYVGSEIGAGTLDAWVSAHTRGSPLADQAAHESGAVEVRDLEDDDRGLVGYVMRNTPGLDTRGGREHGIESAPTEQQRGAVVIDRADVSPLTFGHLA